jgi:Bifunctional DNA primase/polymerase, N-terminal
MTSPLDYAARGWQIFPCYWIERGRCACKAGLDCDNAGKHPLTQHGFYDATTEPGLIDLWMNRWPKANWALRTGSTTGLVVIDIDPRNGGFQSMEQPEQHRGALPETLRSVTGGGGQHMFYAIPPGFQIPKVRGWLPGVDFQAELGYVILPESSHKSGAAYQWINWQAQAAPLPLDIANLLKTKPAQSSRAGSDLPDTSTILMGVPEGQRDDVLFREACRLRRQLGDDARRAVEILILEAARNCTPPFPRPRHYGRSSKPGHKIIPKP